MSFLDELQKQTNYTQTENDAVTNQSTLSPVLDLFSMAGAMRDNPQDAVKLFRKAYAKDPQAAARILFYLRDVRGGQGERDLFRTLYRELYDLDSGTATNLLKHVPEYGRWDDLVEVANVDSLVEIIRNQLEEDEQNMAEGKPVSLIAKWLPSENTSSSKTRSKARSLMSALELKPSQYRKKVVALRKHIELLEQKMSSNQWSNIDYSKVPSQAGRKHTKAFMRHDEGRYRNYLEKASKGEEKMNTETLYTYEVFDAVQAGQLEAANAMWANLPDYTSGTNAIVVADVSGSMYGRPMSVSVSLALYFAEHNTGPFKDRFMTFSARPQVVEVLGNTLLDKLRNIENADWDMNTDLEAVFDSLLSAAKSSGAKGDDMPKVVYIISDMEFDRCVDAPDSTIFENAKDKFSAEGFELPHIVFWNVDARQIQSPATKFDNRVTLISGLSQSTFRYAVEGKTPEELMDSVINSERYAPIVVK